MCANSRGRSRAGALGCILVLLLNGTCRPTDCPAEPADSRATSAVCRGTLEDRAGYLHRLVFRPLSGSSWKRCVDISLLEGFWPGMTIRQARKVIGPENSEGRSRFGTFWLYERPGGTIRISLEDIGSTILPVDRAWRLSALPRDRRIEAVFGPEIVGKIPSGLTDYEAVVLTQCGVPAIHVDVKSGRVARVAWNRNRGSMPSPREK